MSNGYRGVSDLPPGHVRECRISSWIRLRRLICRKLSGREWSLCRACARRVAECPLPDSRALQLDRALARGPQDAFAPDGGTEFVHLHGTSDGSLHMNLPIASVEAAIARGWAEWHPYVVKGLAQRNFVMIYGPRDLSEVQIVFRFVQISRDFAAGLV